MDIPQHSQEDVLFSLSEAPQVEESSKTSKHIALQVTLTERGKTHGDFKENSLISQDLKLVARSGDKWQTLKFFQKESLEMILHKIARIVSGNPNESDHWRDIAGYATLVENILTTGKSNPPL